MHDAFRHVPELRGSIIGAEDSGLRITDEMLAAWDAQAQTRGLGADWRRSDDALDASRRAVLSGVADSQDLWIFAYGSLMWDPGLHFVEVRRASLPGYQRRFTHKTTIGRGSPEHPGLVLSLEPQEGRCEGLAFRIERAVLERESLVIWRREMILGGYQARILSVATPQGPVDALAFVSDPAEARGASNMPLHEVAAVIAHACGNRGSNLEYLRQVVSQLDRLRVTDDYVSRLACLVGVCPSPQPVPTIGHRERV
ncbi:gamma-glutamylcyclotransferase [Aromatoleum toluvorans]|uniref:glutathione-specific gamma-glutamylcyclotransferase n=1 Tax=Aromatoleum toluvorans TaxID=92002 RepID=A0ABX1Q468_9RHOO|nr:gamma-glutamylcyclotransferase [Aromatoleum toluvorans]NMG45290.1 gamma-glutamylcyclotransferase [Aromatoleum toluvorans]